MAPVPGELEMEPQGQNDQSKTLSGPLVGIIYPPPEVRSILFNSHLINPLHSLLIPPFSLTPAALSLV